MFDEGADLGLEVAGQKVVFQEDAVLECLMPALDLALGLGMHGSAPNMAHALGLDIVGQFAGDIAGAVVAKQPGLWCTWARSQPEASNAMSSVSVTFSARMVLHSLQAIMYREKSSSTVDR